MKKRTKDGGWAPMKLCEEAAVLISLAIASALYGIALYKLYHLIF